MKSRRIARHVTRMGDKRNAFGILFEKPEERKPPVGHSRRWENNIKVDTKLYSALNERFSEYPITAVMSTSMNLPAGEM
jgi:hypothetical protein